MARPRKVNRLVFTSAIKSYMTKDERGLICLSKSDREVARELSTELGVDINSEYVRNFRRSQNIASAVTWGGKREGAGRPPLEYYRILRSVNPEIDLEKDKNKPRRTQDLCGIIDDNSNYAIDRWHEKCVLALSRMYGGGDMYLYSNSEIKDKSKGNGKVGKGGGIKNINNSQAFLAMVGQ